MSFCMLELIIIPFSFLKTKSSFFVERFYTSVCCKKPGGKEKSNQIKSIPDNRMIFVKAAVILGGIFQIANIKLLKQYTEILNPVKCLKQ